MRKNKKDADSPAKKTVKDISRSLAWYNLKVRLFYIFLIVSVVVVLVYLAGDVLNFSTDLDDFVTNLVILCLLVSSYFVYNLFLKEDDRREKNIFFDRLANEFSANPKTDLATITALYEGMPSLREHSLNDLLKEFYFVFPTRYCAEEESLAQLHAVITQLRAELEKMVPFEGLPPSERNLMGDIERSIRDNDAETASKKLSELAKVILVTYGNSVRYERKSRWSVPLAYFSILLNIGFVIIAIMTFFK